jgi:hypothetical protein
VAAAHADLPQIAGTQAEHQHRNEDGNRQQARKAGGSTA